MEVHAHSHTPRKRWTHYFWEFIMLFLAVFCGFLAEYQLEHKIEKDRERQFIKSLVEDLQDDQRSVRDNIVNNQLRVQLFDSLLTYFNNPDLLRENGTSVYYIARVAPRINTLVTNNKTIEQLKNSGGFRLIRSNETANRIMEYYNQLPHILRLEAIFFDEFAHYKTLAAKLFDPAVFRAMERPDGTIAREADNPQLRTTNTELLREFGLYIVYLNGTIRSIVPTEEELLKNGKELIDYLRKKYHIK
jgi:hypothetical protein